ncbi:uncharacterized protein LOC144701130 [Wolffia australiana]
MDAVELSLLAPVVVSKLLGSEVFSGIREPETGDSARASLFSPQVSVSGSSDPGRDQCLLVKNKRCLESKRRDRRSLRTTVKSKFDSKNSFGSSNATANGNKGNFASKIDYLELAKSADDLSLDELLDDNVRCPPTLSNERSKKQSSNANESVLISIKRAASLVTTLCTSQESCPSPSSFFTQKQLDLKDSPVYPPKYVAERLGLSSTHHLDDLLCTGRDLAPSPWSTPSLSGPNKPPVDFSKSTVNRSVCQGKWVRLHCHSSLMREDRSRFPDLDLKIGDAGPSTPSYLPPPTSSKPSPATAGSGDRRQNSGRHSPRVAAAAEILCGMAATGSSRAQRARKAAREAKAKISAVIRLAPAAPPLSRCTIPSEPRKRCQDERRRMRKEAIALL